MDYKTVLKEQLLSKTNIDFLVGTILANFKISTTAINKCINIINNNMLQYLNLLDKYPENNGQLIEAINFLNKKCYDDFTTYLLSKYPNGNILRNNASSAVNLSMKQQNQPPNQPQIPSPYYTNNMTNVSENLYDDGSVEIHPIYLSPTLKPNTSNSYDEIIILTEDEKNQLLKKYENTQSKSIRAENIKTDEFLSYLTNPLVLQMFNMMVNQMNQQNINQKVIPKEKTEIVVDEILDINQLQALLTKSAIESNTCNENEIAIKPNIIKPKTVQNKSIENMDENENESDNIIDENVDVCENAQNDQKVETNTFDLENLNNESLILVEKRIKELVSLKNKYLKENNKKMIKQIDKEKTNILNAVLAHKQKIKKEAKENENKINGITLSNTKDPNGQDNIECLNLQFDPTNDFNDLKNIAIGFKSDNKIKEISLVSYYLPFNANNITRFNNKFIVYFNNKLNKIIVPAGKYDIHVLIDAIKNQATFLDFSINEKNKLITIKNTMGMKFDLIIDMDTLFPMLGFSGKQDNYKDKLFYEASQPYNLDINQTVSLSLSGSTKDPVSLEFDKEISLAQPIILKKVTRGISMKQMLLKLTNGIGQYYDFIMPFKMCFKITYIE